MSGASPRRASEPAAGARSPRRLLLATPLFAGAAIMALELVGLRLLAPTFGASSYVWGGTLGAVMAALALGYLLGGALADRHPDSQWVFAMLLASAAWVTLDLWIADAVLAAGERLGATSGPIVATTMLLAVPMVLLSSVSPFVIRLDAKLMSLGTTAGRIYALATVGSLAGTFVTAFWWIPEYGSRQTLRIVIVGLVALGFAGVAWPRAASGRVVAALAAIAVPLLAADPALPRGVVFRAESAYNTVFVEEVAGARMLRLNSARGFHSIQLSGGRLTGIYYDILLLGPHLAGGREVLVLGMGGGTTVHGYRRYYPGARITAVEIDPVVVRAAHEQMGLAKGSDLVVRVEDARPFLVRGEARFDVVEVDVFAGGPYAPFYCLTKEFFAAAAGRLADSGLLAMNVYAPAGDRTLTSAVAATLGEVFPTVLEYPLEEERVLIAFRRPTDLAAIRSRLASTELPAGLRGVAANVAQRLVVAAAGDGPVLTDDRAPVERLTYRMISRLAASRRAG